MRLALTHASRISEDNNQRLEFLGDRVLGMVIAEALYRKRADASEGELAPFFAALVRKETCAEIAVKVGVPEAIHLSVAEASSGGRQKQAILGDAMEAVIAGVYLDSGLEAARDMTLRLWRPYLDGKRKLIADPKTALQEWSQARNLGLPRYRVVNREGPDHAPVFTMEVSVSDKDLAEATGPTKREAEQSAAKILLGQVSNRNE